MSPYIYHIKIDPQEPTVYPESPKRDSPLPSTPSTKVGRWQFDDWKFSGKPDKLTSWTFTSSGYQNGHTVIAPGELGPGIKSNPNVESLKQQIAADGNVHPIEIDHDGYIVDGEHRYRALMDLGVKEIPAYEQLGASGRLKKPYPGLRVPVSLDKMPSEDSKHSKLPSQPATKQTHLRPMDELKSFVRQMPKVPQNDFKANWDFSSAKRCWNCGSPEHFSEGCPLPDQDAKGAYDDPKSSNWQFDRTSGETSGQELRRWQALGEHQATPVHQYDDGWTLRRCQTPDDVERVGSFMRNCWQGFGHSYVDNPDYRLDPKNPGPPHFRVQKTDMKDPTVKHALHDERGIPRMAVNVEYDVPDWSRHEKYDPKNMIGLHQPLGMRNDYATPKDRERLTEWANAQGRPAKVMHGGTWHNLEPNPSYHTDIVGDWFKGPKSQNYSSWVFSDWQFHEAGMTLPQEQKAWKKVEPVKGHDIVHQSPEGWSIRHNTDESAVRSIGENMHNCWQGAEAEDLVTGPMTRNPLPNAQWMSLHDEHGIPRVAFYMSADGKSIHEPLGMRNQVPHPQHAQQLAQWAEQNGAKIVGRGNDRLRHPDEWLDGVQDEYDDQQEEE